MFFLSCSLAWISFDKDRKTFQIIVSSFLPNETHLKLDSEFLTKDTDSHAILGGRNETIFQRPEEKQDITQKGESYLRGKWVTIAALNDKSSFELAEIRVYGSKERIPLKNICEKCGLLLFKEVKVFLRGFLRRLAFGQCL